MLLQTNSYVVPKDRRVEHLRLLRRFRQTLARLGCEHFEVYEQVGTNWSTGDNNGRYVQIMRFRDRRHQLAVQSAERSDPGAQAVIAEFCEMINFPYQQQQGLFAVGFYQSVLSEVSQQGRKPRAAEEPLQQQGVVEEAEEELPAESAVDEAEEATAEVGADEAAEAWESAGIDTEAAEEVEATEGSEQTVAEADEAEEVAALHEEVAAVHEEVAEESEGVEAAAESEAQEQAVGDQEVAEEEAEDEEAIAEAELEVADIIGESTSEEVIDLFDTEGQLAGVHEAAMETEVEEGTVASESHAEVAGALDVNEESSVEAIVPTAEELDDHAEFAARDAGGHAAEQEIAAEPEKAAAQVEAVNLEEPVFAAAGNEAPPIPELDLLAESSGVDASEDLDELFEGLGFAEAGTPAKEEPAVAGAEPVSAPAAEIAPPAEIEPVGEVEELSQETVEHPAPEAVEAHEELEAGEADLPHVATASHLTEESPLSDPAVASGIPVTEETPDAAAEPFELEPSAETLPPHSVEEAEAIAVAGPFDAQEHSGPAGEVAPVSTEAEVAEEPAGQIAPGIESDGSDSTVLHAEEGDFEIIYEQLPAAGDESADEEAQAHEAVAHEETGFDALLSNEELLADLDESALDFDDTVRDLHPHAHAGPGSRNGN